MTYKKLVKTHLMLNGSITSKEAFNQYGITRLSAVIYELRKERIPIVGKVETSKNRYGHTCVYTKYVKVSEQKDEG